MLGERQKAAADHASRRDSSTPASAAVGTPKQRRSTLPGKGSAGPWAGAITMGRVAAGAPPRRNRRESQLLKNRSRAAFRRRRPQTVRNLSTPLVIGMTVSTAVWGTARSVTSHRTMIRSVTRPLDRSAARCSNAVVTALLQPRERGGGRFAAFALGSLLLACTGLFPCGSPPPRGDVPLC